MYNKRQHMIRPGMSSAAIAMAVAVTMAMSPSYGQDFSIDTLVNPDPSPDRAPLSAQDIEQATPHPSEEVTPEELERMRRGYRELNPDTLDLKPEHDRAEVEAEGVPVRVQSPASIKPFWSVGRLIFRKKSDGNLYVCSAQYAQDLKVILTAAHCVYDAAGSDWNTDFTFERAYDEEASPQIVGWRCASIYDLYHTPITNYAYDYAFILAERNNERPQLGLSVGTPTSKNLTAVGYPSNYGDNEQLFKVDGQWAAVSGGIVTMSGNPMRSGNSGGAWFTSFKEGGGSSDNLVVSVNSHHVTGNTTEENGPLFTTRTTELLEAVLDCP